MRTYYICELLTPELIEELSLELPFVDDAFEAKVTVSFAKTVGGLNKN